jgi:hypothetical protein
MNKWIGIALALTALIGGGLLYGWQGLVLGVTIVSFWLLLQFSRFIRVMRIAAEAPMGQIDNAVMLSTKMRLGMKLVELLPLTRSLGNKLSTSPETYAWTDAGEVQLVVVLEQGRVSKWSLLRPEDQA